MQNIQKAQKHSFKWAIYVALFFSISLVAVIAIKVTYLKNRQLSKQYQKDSLQYMHNYKENLERVAKGTNPQAVGIGKIFNFSAVNFWNQYMLELILGATPKKLHFNQASVALGDLEYEWKVYVDTEGNGEFDFYLSAFHTKSVEMPVTGDIVENTRLATLQKVNKAWKEIDDVPFSITVKKNVLVFVVKQSEKFKIRKGSILKAEVEVKGENASKDESTLFHIQ